MKLLKTWGYYNTMQAYKLFNKYANIQVVQNNKKWSNMFIDFFKLIILKNNDHLIFSLDNNSL
jgi:hypothetical protein